MLIKYDAFDPVEDKYMAISLNYRGDIMSKEANATALKLKNENKVSFVEWCPTGFKIGLNNIAPMLIDNWKLDDNGTPQLQRNLKPEDTFDVMAAAERNVVMIGNNA